MINLSVINLRRLLRILLFIIILCIFIISLFFGVRNMLSYIKYIDIDLNKIIDQNFLLGKLDDNDVKKDTVQKIFDKELSIAFDLGDLEKEIENLKNIDNSIIEEIVDNSIMMEEKIDNVNSEVTENEPEKRAMTSVISEHNIVESYTDIYNTVKIKNESIYQLTQEMVTPNIDYSNKKDIIIYHTHTCESYTQTDNYVYDSTGNYRTTNLDYSVARVGEELANYMAGKGYTVIHNSTVHDYPAYTGSYNRSLETVNNLLSVYNSVDMVLDIHRDALGNNSDYGPTVQIGEEKVAQLMFVIGTDGGGLEHPNWNNNLKLAIKIQEKANELYPGLFRPIILRNSRYNQNVRNGAAIIEVGATGNTLEECIGSMKYLSEILDKIM